MQVVFEPITTQVYTEKTAEYCLGYNTGAVHILLTLKYDVLIQDVSEGLLKELKEVAVKHKCKIDINNHTQKFSYFVRIYNNLSVTPTWVKTT